MRDLVLIGGRIIDPATGRDETADIALRTSGKTRANSSFSLMRSETSLIARFNSL